MTRETFHCEAYGPDATGPDGVRCYVERERGSACASARTCGARMPGQRRAMWARMGTVFDPEFRAIREGWEAAGKGPEDLLHWKRMLGPARGEDSVTIHDALLSPDEPAWEPRLGGEEEPSVWDQQTWPYDEAEFPLLTPNCPGCGAPGRGFVAPNVVPMFWCSDDDCQVWSWPPHKPVEELQMTATRLVKDTTPTGGTVHRPETVEEAVARIAEEDAAD